MDNYITPEIKYYREFKGMLESFIKEGAKNESK